MCFKVYIGGRNRLFQLSPDLDIISTIKTDSQRISTDCHSNECARAVNATQNFTDNINKVLLMDYESNKLIICESYQGRCLTRNIQNISAPEENVVTGMVSSSESKSIHSTIQPSRFNT